MKIAFVHDYLNTYGGAERLLESMHEVFPDAPIFTTRYTSENLPDHFPHKSVKPIQLTQSWLWSRLAKQLTFLYPVLFEQVNLGEYDVVISSSAGFAKGVVTTSLQKHICYCHTPPRFLYNYEGESTKRNKWYYAPFVYILDHVLRIWDYASASRVDVFVTNSKNTASRIKKFYKRDAVVLYPPVRLPEVIEGSVNTSGKYFLVVSRLSAYKHVELAVKACTELSVPLIVAGDGPEREKLISAAGPTITFEGFVSDQRLQELYTSCKALIYTTKDEDFGITPIEAMSYGKPVIAHRSGGMRETILENETGMFFDRYTSNALKEVIQKFNESDFNPQSCKKRAEDFSFTQFREQLLEIVGK